MQFNHRDFVVLWHRARAGGLSVFGLLICLLLSWSVPAQQRRTRPAPRPAAQQNFEELKTQADQAREAGQFEEAIRLYRQAVATRPQWVDGWWHLGTLLYDQDRYAEAIPAFKKTAALQPKAAAPVAMQGLCEFRVADYDNALAHIRQAWKLGIVNNKELERVLRYHEGQLLLLKGEFEAAQNLFAALSYDNVNTEDLIIAHGLASLRRPTIPSQISRDYRDRDLIRRVGFAEHQSAQLNGADARQEYARVAADYPTVPNVQYAWGSFLLNQRNDEAALAAFEKELQNFPEHVMARLQIAYIRLKNKEAAAGLKPAQEAVQLHPRLPLGHYILGRVLFDIGQNDKAITELEVARRMAPNEARVHFTLSRAYAKAGRKAEAEQARETFTRLNKIAEQSAQAQGRRLGAAGDDGEEKGRPDPPQ